MPLNIPETDAQVVSRGLVDVQRELSESRPFTKNHWLKAITTGVMKRIFDFYLQLKLGVEELFPDTSTVYAERWAAIYGKQKLAATTANGYAVATGTVSTVVPALTNITTTTGAIFATTADGTISTQAVNIQDLARTGTTATATFAGSHNLASGILVTVAGATATEYNVTDAVITVTSGTEFEYEVTGSPADEAGTAATSTNTTAYILVESAGTGVDYNVDAGSILTLQSPISGVDESLTVDFGSLSGGTDQETDARVQSRMLDKIQNPVALFNVSAIREQAFNVAEVTRVFVQEVTPAYGQVTIYFMMDARTNPIPTGADTANVKTQILTIKPAQTSDADVIVSAPTALSTAFTFSAIAPDSTAMRTAITANLNQFFDERPEVATDVNEDAYRSAIFNTINPSTGEPLTSFALSTPAGNIAILTGEIGTLGTVTYT